MASITRARRSHVADGLHTAPVMKNEMVVFAALSLVGCGTSRQPLEERVPTDTVVVLHPDGTEEVHETLLTPGRIAQPITRGTDTGYEVRLVDGTYVEDGGVPVDDGGSEPGSHWVPGNAHITFIGSGTATLSNYCKLRGPTGACWQTWDGAVRFVGPAFRTGAIGQTLIFGGVTSFAACATFGVVGSVVEIDGCESTGHQVKLN